MITVWDGTNVYDERREAVCDWLKANSIDPAIVAPDAPIVVEGDVISYRAHVLSERGNKQVDADGTGILSEDRIARLIVPWNAP
jgi:hypothetical protein